MQDFRCLRLFAIIERTLEITRAFSQLFSEESPADSRLVYRFPFKRMAVLDREWLVVGLRSLLRVVVDHSQGSSRSTTTNKRPRKENSGHFYCADTLYSW